MSEQSRARSAAGRLVVGVIAVAFVIAGVLGLVQGAPVGAANLDPVVHLVFGLAGLAVVRNARGARRFLIGGGVVYVLWHYAVVTILTSGSSGSLSTANDWLNLWLAASMIALAVILGDRPAPAPLPDREIEPEIEPERDSGPVQEARRARAPLAGPSRARPRRPRPTAGNRPRFAGAVSR